MKKLLLPLFFSMLITAFVGCKKEDKMPTLTPNTTPPTVTLTTGTGYVSADTTIPVGKTFKLGLTATAATGSTLAIFQFSQVTDSTLSSTLGIIKLDNTLSKSSYSFDTTITAQSTAVKTVYTLIIKDNGGLSVTKQIAITTTDTIVAVPVKTPAPIAKDSTIHTTDTIAAVPVKTPVPIAKDSAIHTTDTIAAVPVKTPVPIAKDSTIYFTTDALIPDATVVREFEFDITTRKLVKINYKRGTNLNTQKFYDTLYYTNGKLNKIIQFSEQNAETPIQTITCTYNGDLLTIVQRSYAYGDEKQQNDTTIMTYNASGVLSSSKQIRAGRKPQSFKNITFLNNNISSVIVEEEGQTELVPEQLVEVTSDPSLNPYYQLNSDLDDLTKFFCKNNITNAFLKSDPSQSFLNNTYTTGSDGKITKIVSINHDRSSSTTFITY